MIVPAGFSQLQSPHGVAGSHLSETADRSPMIKRIPSFLFGFALAAAISAVALWVIRGSGLRIDMSRPTVVHHIQELQRLETVVYGMDKIVSGGQDSRYLPKLLAGDRLLLIVYGEVTAGVDLASVQNGQVDISGRSVVLSMPAAEI